MSSERERGLEHVECNCIVAEAMYMYTRTCIVKKGTNVYLIFFKYLNRCTCRNIFKSLVSELNSQELLINGIYTCTLENIFYSTHMLYTSVYVSQSLCKRFTQYGFLWEQDVITTFNSFLMGVAEPHPRKFTRPETVNRSRSATHSANRSRRSVYY